MKHSDFGISNVHPPKGNIEQYWVHELDWGPFVCCSGCKRDKDTIVSRMLAGARVYTIPEVEKGQVRLGQPVHLVRRKKKDKEGNITETFWLSTDADGKVPANLRDLPLMTEEELESKVVLTECSKCSRRFKPILAN